eukprot:1352487-Amphidinium_carterae.2
MACDVRNPRSYTADRSAPCDARIQSSCTGKAFNQHLLPFTEACAWLELGKKRSDMSDRWHDGVFLGVADTSNEVIVATPIGVQRARAVRRKSPEARWVEAAVRHVQHEWASAPTYGREAEAY